MKQSEIAMLMKGMAPVIGKLIGEAVQPFADRIKELEQQIADTPVPVSVSSAIIDRGGSLVLTMSDGGTKDLGVVVGKDAKGIDGLGFDDLNVLHDGERDFTFRFERGEQVKEFKFSLPVVIDRGVWAEGKEGGYAKGDGVTWAGSFWISQKDENGDKPDGGDGWRLAVKRGRDGKSVTVSVPQAQQPAKVG